MNLTERLKILWQELYPDDDHVLLYEFLDEINKTKKTIELEPHRPEWYKDAVVYSLYVDLFNVNFDGLSEKLNYLENLGVNCLWLLPVLDSPMKDAGFDIRNYQSIRPDLLGLPDNSTYELRERLFGEFLEKAHERNIRVIFDIAINHTSEEHKWFRESRKSTDNPYRDYYIWTKDPSLYQDARIIFKGLCESNWQKDGDWYFFHRFFEFQPDLNYRNPAVLLEMTRNFLYWLKTGVDGFRADAIPYLWKEVGTTCENLPKTHTVVKFFRAVIEYVRPGTLLLAEACQKPHEVVKYFGDEDECNAGYHFPLMPQIFKTMASQDKHPVEKILSPEVTPAIPEKAQWLTFLRCHDELSLELVYVSEEDRKYIHDNYCHEPEWNFRLGQGISARLSELLKRDPGKIGLAFSIMLTLPGTPIIYYGDEFGKLNDKAFYKEMIRLSGKDDTRFLVRGKIDWKKLEEELQDPASLSYQVLDQTRTLLNVRKKHPCFGRGSIQWESVFNENDQELNSVLAYKRQYKDDIVLVIQNLSKHEIWVNTELPEGECKKDLLGNEIHHGKIPGHILLKPFEYHWITKQ